MQCITNFLTCKSQGKFPLPYDFQFNGKQLNNQNAQLFQSNFVKTSKYTWYSFLPVGLLFQFQRLANVYFLLIAILQTIKVISPFEPYTGWVPLCVVLSISMLRQGYEDYQRYLSDTQMNYQTMTQVRRNGVFTKVEWSKVVVGDIVKVQQQQLFPADLILLSSSSDGGIAFIETASLDGQKNLKPRSAFNATIPYQQQSKLDSLNGQWLGIPPDKQLHKFSSKMKFNNQNIVFQGDKQLLYRGARLKNTKWIFGLAIYTGKNTKIMLNSQSSSVKMSQIEVKVNRILVIILLIQFICCAVIAILAGFFKAQFQATNKYILWTQYSPFVDGILAFFTYFVLINTMIPISLIVSIQIVKFAQSIFIDRDKLMYSQLRKKFVNVRSASLNQQLGQIQYVFSDKTGTLTCNIMEFKIATIGTRMFGDLSLISNNSSPSDQKGFNDQKLKAILKGQMNQNLSQKITIRNKQGGQQIHFSTLKQLAEQYFLCLGLAHQVVVQKDKKGNSFFQGPSPDQITLVDAAKSMNFQFIKSTQQSTTINIRGAQKTFELLEVFAFTSDRKRMSVLVKSGGTIKMFTKGADSIIKQRLSSSSKLNLDEQLNKFARIGLRTLLIGMRTVSEQQYSTFKKAVESLPIQNKQKQLNQLISNLQRGLYLIGATAVLDRLQDQVPQTIRDLIRANIKVWMLTGDKMETAQNIAKSCNLIQSHFHIIRYVPSPQNPSILNYLRKLVNQAELLTKKDSPKAFLIQGSDLTPIIADDQCATQLANLAKNCEAVVCCRLLPIQKAEVVSIVRQKLNKITLSIGDGANDVPMIKTAHIGVGLYGQQGMGAVQASDYALPQFRMLWRLLLVHGRWNYIRISEMILYFFYKNMLFTIPHLIYAFYMAYSGTSIYDDFYVAGYNLIFTSVPLVVRAVLQQDVNYVLYKEIDQHKQHNETQLQMRVLPNKSNQKHIAKYLPKQYKVNKYLYRLFPKIYFIGQQNCIFNYTNYALWLIEGIIQAILITLFSIYILNTVSTGQNGQNGDLWMTGLTIFSSVILVVTIKLITHTKFWSALLVISIVVISLGLYVLYMWISNFFFSDNIKGTTLTSWISVQTYLVVLFVSVLVLTLDGVIISIDFERGGYSSKMRKVIKGQKEVTKSQLAQQSVHLTDGLTVINDHH